MGKSYLLDNQSGIGPHARRPLLSGLFLFAQDLHDTSDIELNPHSRFIADPDSNAILLGINSHHSAVNATACYDSVVFLQ
jgi:hypothetical protein